MEISKKIINRLRFVSPTKGRAMQLLSGTISREKAKFFCEKIKKNKISELFKGGWINFLNQFVPSLLYIAINLAFLWIVYG